MRLNPLLAEFGTYPFVRLDAAKAEARARGLDLIDFGQGEPREQTPPFILAALRAAIEPLAPYPKAVGLPDLRAAIAAWIERRYQVKLDPEQEIVPTLGSKEAIFHLAQLLDRSLVAATVPGYPVPMHGARYAGREFLPLPLKRDHNWLPEIESLDRATLDRLALLWVNSPNNPTAAIAPLDWLARLAELARKHDFVLACDEAYSELWFDGRPPPSALELGDLTNICVFNTLSKRSAMAGYRSGFVAGDRRLVAALKQYRPSVGVAPLEHVQRASIAAWNDERHVTAMRDRYRAKRDALLPTFERFGLRDDGGDGTFFLWLRIPDDAADGERYALDLLERDGIVVTPGAYFGPGAERHVRVALVPTPERCAEAAARLTDRSVGV